MHPYFLSSHLIHFDQVDLGNVNSDQFIVNINEEEETCRVLTHVGFYSSVSQFRSAVRDVERNMQTKRTSINMGLVDDLPIACFDNVLCHDKLPPK